MQRRDFLVKAALGTAAASLVACGRDEAPPAAEPVAAPAVPAETPPAPVVQPGLPAIRWRLTSSFPRSLDTIFGGAEVLANRVRAMTGGRFDIRVFQGGEIVPGLQALDAVEQGTVEVAHTCSY